jgi:hypothetical protein
MKSENWIILELAAALFALTFLSFFRVPSYEKAVWFGIGVFASGFTMVMGYKFGRSMPQQSGDVQPGRSSETLIRTSSPDIPSSNNFTQGG